MGPARGLGATITGRRRPGSLGFRGHLASVSLLKAFVFKKLNLLNAFIDRNRKSAFASERYLQAKKPITKQLQNHNIDTIVKSSRLKVSKQNKKGK